VGINPRRIPPPQQQQERQLRQPIHNKRQQQQRQQAGSPARARRGGVQPTAEAPARQQQLVHWQRGHAICRGGRHLLLLLVTPLLAPSLIYVHASSSDTFDTLQLPRAAPTSRTQPRHPVPNTHDTEHPPIITTANPHSPATHPVCPVPPASSQQRPAGQEPTPFPRRLASDRPAGNDGIHTDTQAQAQTHNCQWHTEEERHERRGKGRGGGKGGGAGPAGCRPQHTLCGTATHLRALHSSAGQPCCRQASLGISTDHRRNNQGQQLRTQARVHAAAHTSPHQHSTAQHSTAQHTPAPARWPAPCPRTPGWI
jgi:hypothetical protein